MKYTKKVTDNKIRKILSTFYHYEGDKSSSKNKYFEAIINYNKSVCYWSKNIHIINTKRCYVEGEYLANSAFEVNENVTEFDSRDLMKLTHKTNPKLPFMSDCVDIVKNIDGSNCLIAKIPLNVGDVIAVESSFCNGLGYDSRYVSCSNCMKKVPFALITCGNCVKAMFCSVECKIAAIQGFHSYECSVDEIFVDGENLSNRHQIALKSLFKALSMFGGSVELFHKFICNSLGKTIFDFDFNEINSTEVSESYHLLATSITAGLIKYSPSEYESLRLFYQNVLPMYPKMKDIILSKHFNSIVDFLIKQYQSVMAVEITTDERKIWYGGTYLLRPYMRHSCSSNIATMILFGKLIFIVQQPIRKGLMLTVNHALDFYDHPKETRQIITHINCNLICHCVACVCDFHMWKDLPIMNNIDLTHDSLNLYKFSDNVSALYEQFKKNCCYIQNNFDYYPNSELVFLTKINKEIVKKINFLNFKKDQF